MVMVWICLSVQLHIFSFLKIFCLSASYMYLSVSFTVWIASILLVMLEVVVGCFCVILLQLYGV